MQSGCVTADGKKEAFGTAPLYTRSIPHGVSSASGCVRVATLAVVVIDLCQGGESNTEAFCGFRIFFCG